LENKSNCAVFLFRLHLATFPSQAGEGHLALAFLANGVILAPQTSEQCFPFSFEVLVQREQNILRTDKGTRFAGSSKVLV